MCNKSILTIATGKQVYIDMACNLAMSFLLWNKENGLEFYLVTDNAHLIPKKIRESIKIIEIDTAEYDTGFAIKLYLDKFIRTEQTLFIDCDCLVYGDLNPVFEKFAGKSVSAIGEEWHTGEFFCSIEKIKATMNIPYIPVFVGALYYFQKSELSIKIFDYARELQKLYDDFGFIRLRGKENEEPLLAVAMAKFGETVIKDTGNIKADMMSFSNIKSNILFGSAYLSNSNNKFNTWLKIESSKPVIVHYNASFTEQYVYKTEIFRMFLFAYLHSRPLANIISLVFYLLPFSVMIKIKNTIRPFYRLLFGVRKTMKTNR